MTTQEKEAMKEQAETLAAERGLVVLHFVVRGSDSRPVIEIVLDGPRPVLLEDCESVNRSILQELENKLNKSINYRLDILSPGTDEPIRYDYQLKRTVGKTVTVFYEDDGKSSQKTGILSDFNEQSIIVLSEPKPMKGKPAKVSTPLSISREAITLIKQVALIR